MSAPGFYPFGLYCRQKLIRNGLSNRQSCEVFNPQPLPVAIRFQKNRLSFVRNNEVEAGEVDLEFPHICVKAFMQVRAFAGYMIQVVRVEAVVVSGQISGARFNAAGKHFIADAGHSKLAPFFDELLESRWQVAHFVFDLLKFGTTDSPGEQAVCRLRFKTKSACFLRILRIGDQL